MCFITQKDDTPPFYVITRIQEWALNVTHQSLYCPDFKYPLPDLYIDDISQQNKYKNWEPVHKAQ